MSHRSLQTSLVAVRTRASGVFLFLAVTAAVLLGGGLVLVLREGNVQAQVAAASTQPGAAPVLSAPTSLVAPVRGAETFVGRGGAEMPALVGAEPIAAAPAFVGAEPTAATPTLPASIARKGHPILAASTGARPAASDIVRTSPF
jgi:hypothetical protein